MSLVRAHFQRTLASQMAGNQASAQAHGAPGGRIAPAPLPSARPTPPVPSAAKTAASLMALRLVHDLRALKDIQSIARKIEAKRRMLPEYAHWVAGLLAADAPAEGDDILPTIMVWQIDVGDFGAALPLIRHVLRHRLPLPSRYERTAPALIVEEVATAAIKVQQAGGRFPLAVLEEVEELTLCDDMHDEIRAKLLKAIGAELAHAAELPGEDAGALRSRAINVLSRAHAYHDRVGVTVMLRQLAKAEQAAAAPPVPAKAKRPAPRSKAPSA